MSTRWRFAAVDLAGLACCAALAGAGYALAFLPVIRSERHVSDLRTQITAAEQQADQLLQRSRLLDQSLSAVKEKLEESSLHLEPAELVNRRVDALTRKASEAGLSLDEVKPRDPETASLYRTVPIRMKGTGAYPEVATFLHRLRTELRDTTVRSLTLTTDASGESAPSFVFELVWYAAPADRAG